MKRLEVIGIEGLGEVRPGDSVPLLILDACTQLGLALRKGDVLAIAHKIVSKAEGRILSLDSVRPSAKALELSQELEKDARLLEIILQESKRIVRTGHGAIIVETHHGFVCANAGIDLSNVGGNRAVLLPLDPDRSAAEIQRELERLAGVAPGVIISDSFGRPWRLGTTEVAIGVAGFKPMKDYRGETDSHGYELKASVTALADEIASAAELVMGKRDGIPVALVRGGPVDWEGGSARELIRPEEDDLFRRF